MAARTLQIETPTHGRVLIDDQHAPDSDDPASNWLVTFHGYGQNADDALAEAQRWPVSRSWRVVAIEARHRFYTRDESKVVASWMTRRDRDLEITDNLEYVERALTQAGLPPDASAPKLVVAGFSQGVAIAYRIARLSQRRIDGVIALGGDIPPELKRASEAVSGAGHRPWPPVLIGAGVRDTWYTPAKFDDDRQFLSSAGVVLESCVYDAGHEWTDEFRQVAARWLDHRHSGARRGAIS